MELEETLMDYMMRGAKEPRGRYSRGSEGSHGQAKYRGESFELIKTAVQGVYKSRGTLRVEDGEIPGWKESSTRSDGPVNEAAGQRPGRREGDPRGQPRNRLDNRNWTTAMEV